MNSKLSMLNWDGALRVHSAELERIVAEMAAAFSVTAEQRRALTTGVRSIPGPERSEP